MHQSTPKNALGPAFKAIRLSWKWTQQDVSEKLRGAGMKCTRQQLGRIEAQQREIRDFEILYFCEALGVTKDELDERLKLAMIRPRDIKKK